MNIYSLLSFMAFLIFCLIGATAVKANPKAVYAHLIAVMCLCFSIWSFSYTFVFPLDNPERFYFWNRIAAFGWIPFSSIILHLVLTLIQAPGKQLNRLLLFSLYSPCLVLLPYELWGQPYIPDTFIKVNNAFTILETIHYTTFSVISLILLFLWGRRSTVRREKRQAKIMIVTGTSSLVLASVSDVVLPAMGIMTMAYIGHVFVLILVCGIGYASFKYKLQALTSLITTEEILDRVMDLIVLVDTNGGILRVNNRLEELLGYSKDELLLCPLASILASNTSTDSIDSEDAAAAPVFNDYTPSELFFRTRSSEAIPVRVFRKEVKDSLGDTVGIVLIAQDIRLVKQLGREIEERTQAEERLRFYSMHDSLTGLYNRAVFEDELNRLYSREAFPFSLVLLDVDGLKLVNDTMGHDKGDALLVDVARIIVDCCKTSCTAARIGGDEYAVVIPESDEQYIYSFLQDIYRKVEDINGQKPDIPLSISIGYSIAYDRKKSPFDLFKEADNFMYKEKLNHRQSTRSTILNTLTRTLEARDFITDGHAERLQNLVEVLARDIGLPEHDIRDIRLLARFHDIGKVGVPDHILFKKGPLTQEETQVMRRHSEIGYRIAQSSPDLVHIADHILMHHEWWNGMGYPLGKAGEAISLHARILSIADAYDAMTNDRPYRKALLHIEALAELRKCAGIQFDPGLVDRFVRIMNI